MTTGELLKLFRKNKIMFVKHRTRHDEYYSPITNKRVYVPRHKGEIASGTADSILQQAGLK
jgi:predicted RNA binding protein YcfA (HicA-like mRNA interferase family)